MDFQEIYLLILTLQLMFVALIRLYLLVLQFLFIFLKLIMLKSI